MLEIAADLGDLCGEGPIWDASRERLLWVDLGRNLVHALDPRTGRVDAIRRDLMVSAIALGRAGDLILAGATGLHVARADGALETVVPGLPFNDILADPAGRIYAGTIHWGSGGLEKHGALYLVEGASFRPVDEGIELSNGLGLSPDARTLYFTDSARRSIFAYDVDPRTGDLSRRRVFVQVPRDEGLPDGLTVDRDGFVWSAQWYGAQVVRYDPDGAVERRIPMPVSQVSSLAFGGPDLADLYVTTAADPWPSPLQPPGFEFAFRPTGGALYRLRPGTVGKLEPPAAPGDRAV